MALEIKNYAFISYSHKDTKIAVWLQSKLEKYTIPATLFPLVRQDNLPPNGSHSLRPIFMDRTDLTAGILADTLHDNLVASRYLIVVCSPNSAKSEWVSKEVQEFVESGRLDRIIPFVIGGVPFVHSQIQAGKNPVGEECMPKYLVDFTKQHPDKELLGIDLQADGMEQAAMRVASRMLGISFDQLWNRQSRRIKNKIILTTLACIATLVLACYLLIPIRTTYTIKEALHVNDLPLPTDATLSIDGTVINLGNNLDTTIYLGNYPGYLRGQKLDVTFQASFFETVHSEIDLGFSWHKDDALFVARDKTFAVFSGKVIDQDGNPLEGATITIKQIDAISDKDGKFYIDLPVAEQSEEQAIIVQKPGYFDVYRPDECSSENLTYIMYKTVPKVTANDNY